MQDVESRAKQVYEFIQVQKEVQKEKSVVFYNSGNSDKSVAMKEENIYSTIQPNASATWVFLSYAHDNSNWGSWSLSPEKCALFSHYQWDSHLTT